MNIRPSTNRPVPGPSNTNRPPIKPCAICKKEFAWTTLARYGGSVCGRCFKSKTCRCKICDVEKKASEVFIDERGNFCRTCYYPTLLSYSIYFFVLLYLSTFSLFLTFIVLSGFFIFFWSTDGDFFKIHNYAVGLSSVRKSSMFIVVLAVILCTILVLTLVSPWFVYTVNYEPNRGDTEEAFTHEYYLGYVWVDVDESEVLWKNSYLQNSEGLNYPWFYNESYNPFWLDYGDHENLLKHRDYVSSITLVLGITALGGYVLSIITGFIFYRMTVKLEPNFLYLKNRENFQSQVNSFAKKIVQMKKKGIVVSSLNPYLNVLEKIDASEDSDDVIVNNPLNTLYLMILFMMFGVLFSVSAVLFYTQNWYGAVLDDGINGVGQDSDGWMMFRANYNFYGNWHMSPMITFLSFSSMIGLVLTVSHAFFLQRSCYNMIAESIESSSRTSDFKIPSELLIDTEESLATPELPSPGEEILTEVVEAEPELEPEIESGKDET